MKQNLVTRRSPGCKWYLFALCSVALAILFGITVNLLSDLVSSELVPSQVSAILTSFVSFLDSRLPYPLSTALLAVTGLLVLALLAGLVSDIIQGRQQQSTRQSHYGQYVDAERSALERRYLKEIHESDLAELDELFVQPRVVVERNARLTGESKLLHRALHQFINSQADRVTRQTAYFRDLLDEQSGGFALIGEAGLGKTTCLRWTLWHQANQLLNNQDVLARIPLLIEISGYFGEEPFVDFLRRNISIQNRYAGFITGDLEEYLRRGRLLLLLDYNVSVEDDVIKKSRILGLRRFLESYRDNFFILALRPTSELVGFPLPIANLSRFDLEQASALVSAYLRHNSQELIKILYERSDELVWIVQNPYMLRMLTLVYCARRGIPESRTRLVGLFTDNLIGRESDGRAGEQLADQARHFLSRLALTMTSSHGSGASASVLELGSPPVECC